MPSKKKKYNARFPAGRIKKIMQTDEEVGKVAQAVPVIISRTLELFVESLLKKTVEITNAKNAKTLTPSHMKQCILSESRFDFLADLVKNIPDAVNEEDPLSNEVPFSNSGASRRRTSVETSQFNSKPNPASSRSCPSSSNSSTSQASQQPFVSSSTSTGGPFGVSQGVVPTPQHALPSAPYVHISYPHMFPSTESQGVPQVSSTPSTGFQVNLCPTPSPSINTFNQMVPSYTPTSAGYSPNLVIDEDYDN